jgi:hypothetical protein
VNPPAGQFGNSPAYFNDYRYQRRPNESLSLERNFQLTEQGLQLEVRVQFSNIFNRAPMADPVSSNAAQTQVRDKDGETSSGFGYINPTALPSSMRPREGLAIVKLKF